MKENGNFPSNLLVLDGKTWERWSVLMKTLFGAQDVFEVVQWGWQELGESHTNAQRTIYKDSKKKECKTLVYLQQSVDTNNFEKISKVSTSKEVWDILLKYHPGGDKVKKVKFQSLRRKFELIHIEDGENICDYFSRLPTLINQMKVVMKLCLVSRLLKRLWEPWLHNLISLLWQYRSQRMWAV